MRFAGWAKPVMTASDMTKETAPAKKAPEGSSLVSSREPPSGATPPLPLSVRHRSYFETRPLKARLSAAQRLLRDGGPVIVVRGEKGIGKTAFIRQLVAATSGADVLKINARYPMGERLILLRIAQAFDVPGGSDVPALAARLVARGPRIVIAVDEAHHLTPFAIHVLLDLRHEMARAGGRLALLLTGETRRLDAVLSLPSFSLFGAGWMTALDLPRLSREETVEYARHLLEAIGDPQAIDDGYLRSIYSRTRGIPARIHRALEERASGARRWDGGLGVLQGLFVPKLMWPAVSGLAVLAVVFLARGLFEAPAVDGLSGPAPEITSPMPLAADAASPVPAAGSENALPPPAAEAKVSEPAASMDAVRIATDMPPPVQPASEPATTPPAIDATADELGKPAEESSEPSRPDSSDLAWLLSQPPRNYTIQLMGAPDRARAMAFVERLPLPGKTVVVEIPRGSGSRHIVLHEAYGSLAEVRRAVDELPANLRANKPFPRLIRSIQAIAIRR
jgi:DamX protein